MRTRGGPRPATTSAASPALRRPRDQPRAALVGEVSPRPLDQDDEPVAEPDQEEDVDEEPRPPRDRARELHPHHVRDGAPPPDRREGPLVLVDERARLPAVEERED